MPATELGPHKAQALPSWVYSIPVLGWIAANPVVDQLLSSFLVVGTLLLCAEVLLNVLIVMRVPYTEIDWKAYMSEVEPVIKEGDFNYSHLKGGTGPLVYPGGFVWLYGAIYYATDDGTNIGRAQVIFAGLYLATLASAMILYARAAPKTFRPVWLVLLCLSKRIHSIYVLRLFNDGPAMLLLYLSILCLISRRRVVGCIFYSLAVSVKMNIFLFAPGLFLILLSDGGVVSAFYHIAICAIVQGVVGLPFLASYPKHYILQSFNLARTFKQYWSVNFKWVPCEPLLPSAETLLNDCEGLFTSKAFGIGLLFLTALTWVVFSWSCGAVGASETFLSKALAGKPFSAEEIVTVMLVSNFIGVAFSKSLHFQFYIWYFHALPFLLWCTPLPDVAKLLLVLGVELCWNPWKGETSTVESSMLLTFLHIAMLCSLFVGLKVKPKVLKKSQ